MSTQLQDDGDSRNVDGELIVNAIKLPMVICHNH
jgi:hypothetical protein